MQARLLRAMCRALGFGVVLVALALSGPAGAAPYAAMVMDARNGEVIFARNHDTRLHPASLTKMMTIYVAFEAIQHGEVTLDTMFTVSQRATGTPCVCLGLRPGQRISLRHLIRAAALRSANDASVVIAEGISGSVEAFAQRMTRTARAMGMSNTTFLNPHGLTQSGHMSTARDMTILGRQLYFDFPQYYNLFSRRSEDAGVAVVPNTNRRFLDAYQGADGIKTGFTRAAGFNLTASARRGDTRIIATMFGGSSVAARNAHVAELLDIGFSRAPARVAVRPPQTPPYGGRGGAVAVADAGGDTGAGQGSARTIRLQTAVRSSPRPMPRPAPGQPDLPAPAEDLLLAVRETVETAISTAATAPEVMQTAQAAAPPPASTPPASTAPAQLDLMPPPRPDGIMTGSAAETALADAAAPAALSEADLQAAEAAGFTIADPADIAALQLAEASTTDAVIPEASQPPAPGAAPVEILAAEQVASEVPASDGQAETMLAQVDTGRGAETDPGADSATSRPETGGPGDAGTVWTGSAEAFLLADGPTDPVQAPQTDTALIVAGVDPLLGLDLDRAPDAAPPAQPRSASGIILTSSAQPVGFEETRAVAAVTEALDMPDLNVVQRLSTSDSGRIWGVSIGQFNSRNAAERSLITVKMAEANSLSSGISRIRQTSGRFEASFAGLTLTEAERACMRLQARRMDCTVLTP